MSTFIKSFIIVFFFFAIICSAEESYMTIDSLCGKAEVQRAGHQEWINVQKNSKLFNNDILRVLDKSLVRAKWRKRTTIYIYSNSQILINLNRDIIHNIYFHYSTVFFGAVYFIIKEILPDVFSERFKNRVYTPTSVVAIRGTSFSLNVNKKNGDTNIKVINGTVLAKNILKNQGMFLSAGYKTHISINTDPLMPSALVENDIKELKTWVPPKVIEKEMNQQILKAKQDYSTISGKLEDKVIVLPFINMSTYKGKWKIDKKIATLLAEKIKKSHRINSNAALDLKKVTDPIASGLGKNARFVVMGDIKHFDIIQKAEISAAADKYREISIAHVCINLQMVDVKKKMLIYENDICGEVFGKNIKENNWQYISTLDFNMEDEVFSSCILGKAFNMMLNESSLQLYKYIDIH